MSGQIDEAQQATRVPSRDRSGLALCLSGGGYRATLFHLGAARRLYELGLLGRLDTISSVSGGSIFAGVLADLALREGWGGSLAVGDFEAQVAAPIRQLTKKDMRTVPFLLYLPVNWLFPSLRAWHFAWLCKRNVSERAIGGLPEKPRFVFCATDITFGVNWESSRQRVGSFQAGYLADGGAWAIGRAVAASACFPPVFGPMRVRASADQYRGGKITRTDEEGNSLRRRLALSDGGVYDNMGLEPAWKSHACVLVSDCGAPFQFRAGGWVVRRLLRYTSVIQNQAHAVRTRMFFAGIDEGWHKGARWGIGTQTNGTEPGYSAKLTERIAQVRTDLNRFTDAEQRILENHGYCVTDARMREQAPDLLPAQPPPATPPHLEWMDEGKARAALRASHKRVSLRRFVARLRGRS